MSLVVGWQAELEKNGRFSVFPKFRRATQGRHHAFKMIAASAGCTSAGGQKEFKLAQGLEKIQENPFLDKNMRNAIAPSGAPSPTVQVLKNGL